MPIHIRNRALILFFAVTSLALANPAAQSLADMDLSPKSVSDGVYTAEQAARGRQLYVKACAACHQPRMQGLKATPPLAGPQFIVRWSARNVADLVAHIRTSMPPGAGGTISFQQATDLAATILHANRFRPGRSEMPANGVLLSTIRFPAGVGTR